MIGQLFILFQCLPTLSHIPRRCQKLKRTSCWAEITGGKTHTRQWTLKWAALRSVVGGLWKACVCRHLDFRSDTHTLHACTHTDLHQQHQQQHTHIHTLVVTSILPWPSGGLAYWQSFHLLSVWECVIFPAGDLHTHRHTESWHTIRNKNTLCVYLCAGVKPEIGAGRWESVSCRGQQSVVERLKSAVNTRGR